MLRSGILRAVSVLLISLIMIFGCDTKKEDDTVQTEKTAEVQNEPADDGSEIQDIQIDDTFCTRENLKSLANKYFNALAAHDPSMLPLAPDVKFTENGNELKVGEGFWKTAGKVLLTRHLIDTLKCGTHTQAVVEEPDAEGKIRPILFGVRLQYKNKKITEIETIIAREKEFAFTMGGAKGVLATKDQDWEGILPPSERISRLALKAAADDYFDMFAKEPVVHTPFARECDRWENGVQTTTGGDVMVDGKNISMPAHDCSPKGLVISNHGPRRVPLIDVEAGIVVTYVHFASSLPDFHMFKVKNREIKLIQAVVGPVSKSMGWPDEPICKD